MCNEISLSPKAAEGKPQKRGSVRAGCFGAVFAGKNKHARTHARTRSHPSRRARLSLAHHRLHALRALFIRRVESFFLPSVCFGEKKRERGRRRKKESYSPRRKCAPALPPSPFSHITVFTVLIFLFFREEGRWVQR